MEVSCQFHAPSDLSTREIDSGTHWIEGWVASTVDLDAVEMRKIFFFCRESNPILQPSNPSLYRLSYPGLLEYMNRRLQGK
jgi:hypothetical protein